MSLNWLWLFPTGEEDAPNPKGIEFYHNVFCLLMSAYGSINGGDILPPGDDMEVGTDVKVDES